MAILTSVLGNLFVNNVQITATSEGLQPDWNGVALTGANLTAVGIVGANPYATLYPDGSIVGGSDNGLFFKYPNGTLICTGIGELQTTDAQMGTSGIYRSTTTPNLTFAMPFSITPKITVSTINTINQYCWAGPLGAATTTYCWAVILSTGVTGQAKPIYQAIGRWK